MSERRALKLLDERRPELENCAFCPKLCRTACPISDVEPKETLTPWGKMGSVFAVARERAPASPSFAEPAWGCTGCFACRQRCEQRNSVAETLFDARAPFAALNVDPPGSARVRARFDERDARLRMRVQALREAAPGCDAEASTALLLGCDYALRLPAETADALAAARGLFGSFRLVGGCCGYPLLAAGEPVRARAARERVASELGGVKRFVALDAGCAYTLGSLGAVPLLRAAHDVLASRPVAPPADSGGPVRYHDPCLLGRGLDEYERPRQLVERLYGAPPAEFLRQRAGGRCSGGGGLLPVARPDTARAIAEDRVSEHERLGGGTIVTACAQSLRQFRAAGAKALDLATIIRRLSGE
jgi:Fe-S oxidoreductase